MPARSASALAAVPSSVVADRESHLDLDDGEEEEDGEEKSVYEELPVDDQERTRFPPAIGEHSQYAEGQGQPQYTADDRSRYPEDERPLSEYPDDDRSLYPEDERPLSQFPEDGERPYSVWSEAESRRSFMDTEKSANTRARFVKRVEAMYGEDVVPPVPYLSPNVRKG